MKEHGIVNLRSYLFKSNEHEKLTFKLVGFRAVQTPVILAPVPAPAPAVKTPAPARNF
jgi:hypothetical protein